jgi:hypothetical protein
LANGYFLYCCDFGNQWHQKAVALNNADTLSTPSTTVKRSCETPPAKTHRP